MKALVVLGIGPGSEMLQQVARGEVPRQDYMEIARRLDADVTSFGQACASKGPLFQKLFLKHPITGSIVSAILQRGHYDTMFTTGEDVGLLLACLLRLTGWRGRLVMIFHNCRSRRRKKLFRFLGPRSFAHLICVSQAQKNIVEELGFPPEKVTAVLNPIDEKFFNSASLVDLEAESYVFSCGLENRNYALLSRTAATLPYKFRLCASGFMSLSGFQESGSPDIPPNMILEGRLSFDDLKRTYANARFIVVPVNDVSYAAGVTGIVEAMAMGKAMIVTASHGIAEYLFPGVSALVVPPDDINALAEAIRTLWDDPQRCAEMGRYNRALVESTINIDRYCDQVAAIVRG